MPGVSIKLVPSGSKLEIRVKGENVTPGYVGQDDVTAEAFDEEGFYRIGDAGKLVDENDANKGIAFPIGTTNTFKAVYCPADMNQWVNTRGQRYYISTKNLDHNKGVEIHMEARPVAWCQRLNGLVEVDAGAPPAP